MKLKLNPELNLTWGYMLALSLVAVLSVSAYLVVSKVIVHQKTSAAVLNYSGRQRMLSQRAVFYVMLFAKTEDPTLKGKYRAEVLKTVEFLKKTHLDLIHGDPELNLPGNPSDEVRALYFSPPVNVDAKLKYFANDVRMFVNGEDPGFQSLNNPHVASIVENASGEMLDALNTVVSRYQLESEETVARLSGIETGILVMTLLLLALEAAFIFRPMAERIKRQVSALEKTVDIETARRMEQEKFLIQQSKMAAMGEMLESIAHQWKQPLNAVGLVVQDIEDAYTFGEVDKAYVKDLVEKTMTQVNFMTKTVDDFRNFFRPSKEKKPFDIAEAARDVLNIVSHRLAKNSIAASVVCRQGVTPVAMGYPNEFRQVVINIVHNAVDAILEHRPKGRGGVIDIEVDEQGDGRLVMSITNNGGSIPTEILERIFQPYFTTKAETRGTGIGLYMSRVIIQDNMGGSIRAENVGDGARFIIELARHKG
jgi:signal transduction histidine kinase